LTLSHHAEGKGAIVEGLAAIADLFNPASIPKDILDTYRALVGAGPGSTEGASQSEESKKKQ